MTALESVLERERIRELFLRIIQVCGHDIPILPIFSTDLLKLPSNTYTKFQRHILGCIQTEICQTIFQF